MEIIYTQLITDNLISGQNNNVNPPWEASCERYFDPINALGFIPAILNPLLLRF